MSDFRVPPDQLGLLFQAPTRHIWSVRELVGAVRTSLEREFTDVYIEGEISNYRPAESGHLYFTLKDGDAQMRIVMFRSQARLLRFKPANGMQVIARGRLTVYEARGELQLSAEYLEPKGAGALQVAFEQLKAKLAEEGLFDASRKKPMPAMPKRIGIVTSPRGAALQDILNILRRRHQDVHILIFPAQVQGDASPAEVSAGIKYFNKTANVDVIIVARGGGSAEDLAAFNHEGLARVIAASEIPLVSAVGHETDFTIADFVADLRAPTPSAAAEMVIETKQQITDRVLNAHQRLARAVRYRLMMARSVWTDLARNSVFVRMKELLNRRQQRTDELQFRLVQAHVSQLQQSRRRLDVATSRVRAHDLRRILAGLVRELGTTTGRLTSAARQRLQQNRAQVMQAHGKLEALSPLNILERGYALVFDASGRLIKDVDQVNLTDEITARLARGSVTANVKSKKK
ncbi:MAG TPA: exodeoxyribonuclease VII large subunit [Terriglobales bacterium]|nr:exodeoxyribonuclease VII large subunit [Terriglobales bacterium]